MTTKTPSNLDVAEALYLLAKRTPPWTDAVTQAADRLLATLPTALDAAPPGVKIHPADGPHEGGLLLMFTKDNLSKCYLHLFVNRETGDLHLRRKNTTNPDGPEWEKGPGRKIDGLWYNAVTKELEGTAKDTFHNPLPGQPVRRRSAVAVIIEAALNIALPEPNFVPLAIGGR